MDNDIKVSINKDIKEEQLKSNRSSSKQNNTTAKREGKLNK